MYTAIAYGAPAPINNGVLGYAVNILELMSALNLSRSLNPADLRIGTLAARWLLSRVVGPLDFNASTGINVARIGQSFQMLPSGDAPLIRSLSDLTFPYDWPWHRVLPGDTVQQQPAIKLGHSGPRHRRTRCVGGADHHRASHLR